MFGRDKEEKTRRFGQSKFSGRTSPARPAAPRGSGTPGYRVLLLGVLLAMTIFAIRVLNRPEEGITLMIVPFDTVGAGPGEAILGALTDRVATRISRVPEIGMVVLDRGQKDIGSATYRLGGLVVQDGDELRVEVRLAPITGRDPPEIFETRGPADQLGPLADEIATWIGATL
jgi:hypothetical protein